MCPDKDKKGWVLRSYDNNSCFDEKSVPHSIQAAPAAKTEIWVSDCLHISEHRSMSADLGSKWDAMWLLLWSVLLWGNVVCSLRRHILSVRNINRPVVVSVGVPYIHKNYIQSGFRTMFLFSARSVKLWWQLESKCQAWLTTTDMGFWLVNITRNWSLIGWPTPRTLGWLLLAGR